MTLPRVAGFTAPYFEVLGIRPADGNHEEAPLDALCAQGVGNAGRRSSDEHPIIGCELLPPERAVALPRGDVLNAQCVESLARDTQQRSNALDAEHLTA